MKLVVASNNLHKVKEIKEALALPCFEIFSLLDFPSVILPEETAETFEGNASMKATVVRDSLHLPALADDSGLVVEALSGRPGIFSARYAGKGATDEENRKKLLTEMRGLTLEKRGAYFIAALVLALPEREERVVTATLLGTIAERERGSEGFGYDSLFIPKGYDKTLAELGWQVKKKISHRAKALVQMRKILESEGFTFSQTK